MHTKHLLALKNILLGLAIGWTVSVIILCLISFSTLPSIGVSDADKYVHATFHFVFTMLWGMYFWKQQNKLRIPRIITVVFVSLSFGILIEFLQETWTTTRQGDILDVAANLTGALLALFVFVFIKKIEKAK
jgi:VanZ family protein